MELIVWGGALLTLLGLAGLVYCMAVAARARREGAAGPDMERRLRRLVAVNLTALALSTLGLMAVIVGLALG
ncbi:hypothetical protein [Jannaschia sp. W003]|uniref:hypothetical protein n=1 Tax=Jannaschia sp. W003 TaxID=2867012 RepID=UPI0021A53DC6|nr:hypothetical protein [Jannaschia sp. W003]UWQ21142.1 hypothetical protein K3554_14385 [Jannaschia sp. W003]